MGTDRKIPNIGRGTKGDVWSTEARKFMYGL
jgi:hypothetical protein